MAKVDLCFSFNKLTRWYLLHFLSWLWPMFSTEKKLDDVDAENLPKITANVQKRWSRSRSGLIFCRMKILTMPRKKAQNSDAERGRLHGEIDVLKFQILFCKYLCTTCLLQILASFRSVQLVPFFLTELIEKCSFCPLQI